MAKYEITRGKYSKAQKILIYGHEGVGKSTFASQFPDPLFIDTEGSTNALNVARFPAPSSWTMLKDEVQCVIDNPEICRTLVIDTADWAERLEIEELCNKHNVDGLEGWGWGKGYTYAAEEWGRFLDKLSVIVEKGIYVVVTAHAQMKKVELPEEMGAYDHWEMKLSKKAAPLLKEWADAVFFATYRTIVVNVDGQGTSKGKNKAQGGERVMHTTHTPFWDAKNREGLPETLPFSYEAIAHIIRQPEGRGNTREAAGESVAGTAPAAPEPVTAPEPSAPEPAPAPEPAAPKEAPAKEKPHRDPPDPRIPKALRDLMMANDVTAWDIQDVVQSKGYYPSNVEIWDYDPDFIDGCLVGAWEQVYGMIKEMWDKEEIPFS